MRIHSLRFRGVGPYLHEQSIDFTQLGESGLYLINGPTGAGKSTIIDCICFALFGKLASDDADLGRMRSDFAGPSDPTEVDLTFETAAGVFRVIRTPQYLKAKKRGTGETVANATCQVFRVPPDGNEQTIATQVASANKELLRLIGLTREQFVQTVVLPQGEFAAFLNASTQDRSEVLKRIFNTHLYERVVAILKEDAREAASQKTQATNDIKGQIHVLAATAGLDDATRDALVEFASTSLDEQLMGALDGLLPEFELAHTTASTEFTTAKKRADDADRDRDRAKREANAQNAVTTATRAVSTAATAVDAARAALTPLATLAAAIGIELDESTEEATWRQRASQASSHAGELTALLADEASVAGWPVKESAAVQAIEDLAQLHAQDRVRLDRLPEDIKQQQAIAMRRPKLEESNKLNERGSHLDRQADQFAALDGESARLPDLTARVEAADAARQAADAGLASATEAYRAGVAASLALDLEPGRPCVVCGATEHPAPARHDGEAVSLDDVETLREHAARALATFSTAAEALEGARKRVEELTGAITMSRDGLVSAQAELQGQLLDLERRSADADSADAAIVALEHERAQLTLRANEYAATNATMTAALEAQRAEMAQTMAKVASARGPYPSIADRLIDVRALEGALTQLAGALANRSTALANKATADQALAELEPREGFGDVDAAQQAWLIADGQRLDADRVRAEAAYRLQHLRDGRSSIERLCENRRRLVSQNADLIHLAERFSAGRGSDMGLHIYVLRSLFANVMDSANRRFESLLNGRYRLVPAPESEGDGRSLHGLGVSVEDQLTGRVRPAKTLSGGETFCASLALALGLSDVVRMTAGGIDIGSLFIDEGFGSLDGDQLDDVMLMLGHLSSDGRRVGVISHVDSMKSAITERIDVTAVGENQPTSLRVSWMS